MIEDEPKSKFTLRVWFMTDYVDVFDVVGEMEDYAVELTPSSKLPGKSITVTQEELPDYITQPIAMLKMLRDRERIPSIGKKIARDLFYVLVRVEDWLQYTDDKTKEK